MKNQKSLIDHCKGCLSKKFGVNRTAVKTDMDAISILISTKDMTPERRTGIKEFLNLFGNELTLRATLPNSVIGSSRNGIFGCREDKECMHLPTSLQNSEVLVMSTPVKIAVHRSCKERLWKILKSKDIHFSLSGNNGLCFNPRHAANAANYNVMIEAIIDSCAIRDSNHHVIHVADFGCKLQITPGKQDCPLGKIFTVLKKLTGLGIQIEIAQLDFGFNVPARNNLVPNYSWHKGNQNARNRSKRMFKHVSKEVYPTHHIYPNVNRQDIDLAKTRGTLSLKKQRKKWEEIPKAEDMIRIEHENEDLSDYHRLAGLMYRCEQDNNENLILLMSLSPNSVHSLKVYSTLAHQYLQQRFNFMMKDKHFCAVGRRSMKYLSEYVKRVEEAALKSLRYHFKYCTVHSRVEISIRFPPWDKGMRRVGHYTDYLVHALLAMNELCSGESHSFSVHFHDPERLVTQVKNMASEVLSYLHFRKSLSFNQVYKNERTTDWLRMMLSLMMVTAGLVPQPKLKWIRHFYKDNDRFDPYGRASHLNTETPRYKKRNEITPVPNFIRRAFGRHLKRLGFSENCRNILTEFAFNLSSPGEKNLSVYIKLRLSDKLLLATWLLSEILPFLSKFMAKTNDNDDSGNTEINRTYHETADAWQPHHLEISKNNPPGDAISLGINKLSGFATFADVRCPVFTATLCKFILNHHQHTLQKSNQRINSGSVQLQDAMVALLNSHVDDGAPISNANWQRLCTNLHIKPRASNQTNYFYIEFTCKHLLFPCQGVHYEGLEPASLSQKNLFLNENFLSVVRIRNLPNSKKVTICRNGGSETIKISKRNDVLEEKKLSTVQRGSGFGYDVLRSISEFATESDRNIRYPNNEKHRKLMKQRLMNQTEDLCDIFLTDQGQVIEEFQHLSSLADLEIKHKFLLEHTTDLSKAQLCTRFLPRVIIPICVLVTDTTFAYYDNSASKTCIYTCQQGKCVLYEGDSLDFAPKESCFIIRHDGPKYTWCKHPHNTTESITGRLSGTPREEYQSSLMNARTNAASNIEWAVSGSICKPSKPLMASLRSLIAEQYNSHQELPPPNQEDSLAIIPFLQQLFAHHPSTSCMYHQSITNNCKDLLLSTMNIVSLLNNNDTSKITHQLICPIICLKYKVIIGVFFRSGGKQRTIFYFYDSTMKMVLCRNVERHGYHTLVHYPQTIYINVGADGRSRYYTPTTHLSYFKTIRHKFFHVDFSVLMNMMTTLAQQHNMHFQPKDQITNVEGSNQTIMTLTTTCNTYSRTLSLDDLRHVNIEHCGLISIFTYSGTQREACIVHHPDQNESEVKSNIDSFIDKTDNPPQLNITLVKGKQPKDCEFGLYMLMYAWIAHKTSSVEMFSVAVNRAHEHNDMDDKVREWLFMKYTQDCRTDYLPFWLEELVTND